MVWLEALQLAANGASTAVNARGTLLEDYLQDILAHAREVTLHGVRHGAAVALAAAQIRSEHELHHLEPNFPMANAPEDLKELVEDFEEAAEAIANVT